MRVRLTLWVVSIFTVIQWSISGVLWLYQSSSIEGVFNERLRERTEEMVEEISRMVPGSDRAWMDRFSERQTSFVHTGSLYIDVFRKDGRSVISGEPEFAASDVPVQSVLGSGEVVYLKLRPLDAEGTQKPVRAVAMVTLGADLEPYVLVVGTDDGFAQGQLALVGRLFLLSGLLGPLVTAACGWYIAGIAVAPFERLRRLASEVGPQSLNKELDMPVHNKELAELRDQLEEARVRIRNAFEVQERFMTNVSHELKTPIAVVLTEAQTLRSIGASEEVMGFVESTEEEMQRLGKLVESFLTLARVRDGHHDPRAKRFGANDLAMEAVEHCAKMADQCGVVLAATLMEDDDALDASVAGDPELLRTMLDNLIRNAIRFTPPGKRVDVTLGIEGAWLHVRVLDEGPGIPCDQIGSVFDRFRQATNQKGRGSGHGLGLAIAQGIAELHGGRISVENNESPNGGCCFEVRLPLVGRSGVGGQRSSRSA
jgi:signal transduction histidine kinase